jgi:hypothetical protein
MKLDVAADGLTFPEAPRWRDGKRWFVDVPVAGWP